MKRREFHGLTIGHRRTWHPLYRSWAGMISRCHGKNPHKDYGLRGISVCERWRNSFTAFVQDMGDRPQGMSLDRIDNDGNYEPSNCRWATPTQQLENRRKTRLYEVDGERLTVAGLAKKLGLSRQAMQERLREWPLERALTEPAGEKHAHPRYIEFRGQRKNIAEWARCLGIGKHTLRDRIERYGERRALELSETKTDLRRRA